MSDHEVEITASPAGGQFQRWLLTRKATGQVMASGYLPMQWDDVKIVVDAYSRACVAQERERISAKLFSA